MCIRDRSYAGYYVILDKLLDILARTVAGTIVQAGVIGEIYI